jgi:glycerol uptake facilitator-like aquaporin
MDELTAPRTTLTFSGQLTAAFVAELLFACALAYIVLSVAANPAVGLGGAVLGMFDGPTLWIYTAVELVAGAVAAFAFRALTLDDPRAG